LHDFFIESGWHACGQTLSCLKLKLFQQCVAFISSKMDGLLEKLMKDCFNFSLNSLLTFPYLLFLAVIESNENYPFSKPRPLALSFYFCLNAYVKMVGLMET
jgi:hypothetical protein